VAEIFFLVGDGAPRLRRTNAEQLARELERLYVVDGPPLTAARSAAAVIQKRLEDGEVVELEEPEMRAVYVVIAALDGQALSEDLVALRNALVRTLEIPQ
jgi:hypothetical protein